MATRTDFYRLLAWKHNHPDWKQITDVQFLRGPSPSPRLPLRFHDVWRELRTMQPGDREQIVDDFLALGCFVCLDRGVIETGNNDLPCSCKAGDRAFFNVGGRPMPMTGAEVKAMARKTPEPPPPATAYTHLLDD